MNSARAARASNVSAKPQCKASCASSKRSANASPIIAA
jgi:hypothetical protein